MMWVLLALWAFGSPILGVVIGKILKRADQRQQAELVEQRQHLKLVS